MLDIRSGSLSLILNEVPRVCPRVLMDLLGSLELSHVEEKEAPNCSTELGAGIFLNILVC